MKRLTIFLAAAMLSLAPAAAEARFGGTVQASAAKATKGAKAKARKGSRSARRSAPRSTPASAAAKACKTEKRKLGTKRFKGKYGKRNAVGACVKAAKSRAAAKDEDDATEDDDESLEDDEDLLDEDEDEDLFDDDEDDSDLDEDDSDLGEDLERR